MKRKLSTTERKSSRQENSKSSPFSSLKNSPFNSQHGSPSRSPFSTQRYRWQYFPSIYSYGISKDTDTNTTVNTSFKDCQFFLKLWNLTFKTKGKPSEKKLQNLWDSVKGWVGSKFKTWFLFQKKLWQEGGWQNHLSDNENHE